jgi:hypothetical protein
MARKWEYCTMVATHTVADRMLVVTFLRAKGKPEGRSLGASTLGAAIAQLGAEGWEMCGFYPVSFPDGLGQQFYFKRLMDD